MRDLYLVPKDETREFRVPSVLDFSLDGLYQFVTRNTDESDFNRKVHVLANSIAVAKIKRELYELDLERRNNA